MSETLNADGDNRLQESLTSQSRTPEELIDELKALSYAPFPIDLEAIYKLYNIEIIYEAMDKEISGILEKRRSGWIVFVNQWHHLHRQRFTLAHELAHFFLHRNIMQKFTDVSYFSRTNEKRSKMEIEADQFAANLLMPKEIFIEQIESGNNSISNLSDIFKVSMLAVKFRAKNLGYI